ncbi:MAG TPA: VOC family protein [Steroidobacteraceae bacterium]|nr:VOC family protein [Steroidobacteraceae bacterium]
MTPVLGVAQIALTVTDLARAKAFYADLLGLSPLFDAGKMSFLDAGGVRIMLSAQGGKPGDRGTLVYLKVADVRTAHGELSAKGIHFEQPPHVIGRAADREVWLAWCSDPDGNLIGLMS